MRFNQVLRATRVAASVLCVLVAMLMGAAGFGARAGETAAVDWVERSRMDMQWSVPLGDEVLTVECYAWYHYATADCAQDAVECAGETQETCVEDSWYDAECPSETSYVGVDLNEGNAGLFVKNCGMRNRRACEWVTTGAVPVCQPVGIVTTQVPCGGVKRTKGGTCTPEN